MYCSGITEQTIWITNLIARLLRLAVDLTTYVHSSISPARERYTITDQSCLHSGSKQQTLRLDAAAAGKANSLE